MDKTFVGFVETRNNVYYFATNIEPAADTDMANFEKARTDLTMRILLEMGVIK